MKLKCVLIASVCMALISGCATNKTLVREQAAEEFGCAKDDVDVEFIERPYMGITRYSAQGCGMRRQYVCKKWYNFYSLYNVKGIPLEYPPGCERDKS